MVDLGILIAELSCFLTSLVQVMWEDTLENVALAVGSEVLLAIRTGRLILHR